LLDTITTSVVPYDKRQYMFEQEAQLMLTNRHDAHRGQSRSSDIVPFRMLDIVSSCAIATLSLRRAVFLIFGFKNVVTLKSASDVTKGH